MKYLINSIKGLIIGISILIPGVSGGTMAIILGVYDDLIHSISSFFHEKRKNALFLLQIGIGGVIGIVLFSKVISYGLEKFHFPLVYMFLGVVCGGIPVLYKKTKVSLSRKRDYIYCVIGLLIALLMLLKPSSIINLATHTGVLNFLFLILAGIIIAIALILPGISTSFMLLTLGLYDVTLDAIHDFNLPFLIPVGLGAVIGTISTTKLLENLMNKYPRKTYLLILGFVVGSVIQVFPGVPKGMTILYSAITFVLGFIVIRIMSRFSE